MSSRPLADADTPSCSPPLDFRSRRLRPWEAEVPGKWIPTTRNKDHSTERRATSKLPERARSSMRHSTPRRVLCHVSSSSASSRCGTLLPDVANRGDCIWREGVAGRGQCHLACHTHTSLLHIPSTPNGVRLTLGRPLRDSWFEKSNKTETITIGSVRKSGKSQWAIAGWLKILSRRQR